MRSFLKRFYRELICLVCLSVLSAVVHLWVRYDGVKNPEIGSVLLVIAGVDLVIFVRTFRRLWREKMRRVMVNAVQRIFEKAVRRLTGVLEKMGFVVELEGIGRVAKQSIEAGIPLQKGMNMKLTLK